MLWASLVKNVTDTGSAERTAVVSDESTLTYGELLARVDALAEVMQAASIGPGQVLLAYLENVPAFLVALIACTKVGCTFAPLDVGLTDGEVAGILNLTRSDLVVCDISTASRCEQFSKNLLCVDTSGTLQEQRISTLPEASLDADIACMQFSSGSTAASKGVLLSKQAFFYRSYYLMRSLGLNQDDRTICTLPLSHTHGAECLALPTLMACGTLYLKSPKFSFPLYIIEELERLKITFFSSIPQFYDFAVKIEGAKTPDLSALKHPFCGSAALAKTTAEAFFEKYGVHIKQGYGLAELSVICINNHEENVVYDSIGKPIEGIEWKLLGDDHEGELIVRSKAMFSGYINDEKNTQEKLQDGWLHTGDVISVDDSGLFRVIGRKEDFIKINGFKVYAAEVEAAIISLDWIKECAVLSEKDNLGTEKMVAYFVPGDWSRTPAAMEKELIQHLRSRLSDYKIPKRCMAWQEFPKNPLGKILKSKIRAMA